MWRNKIPSMNLYIFWKIYLLAFWISNQILPLTPRVVFSWSTKLCPVGASRESCRDTSMGPKLPEDDISWLSNVDFWSPRSKNPTRGNFLGQKLDIFPKKCNFVTRGSPVATCRESPFLAWGPIFGWAEKQGSHWFLGMKIGSSS